MTTSTEKRAPVQGYPGGIPWAIHLEAYEVYCKRWSPQPALIDLEGKNCRGGFSTGELDDFIPGWRDRVAEFGLLKTEAAQLRTRVDDYATEINRLRNVIQAACTGGLDHMIERWKVLFPDAPVPSVNAPDAADAKRYQRVRAVVRGRSHPDPRIWPGFDIPIQPLPGTNVMKGSVAQHFDAAVDALDKA